MRKKGRGRSISVAISTADSYTHQRGGSRRTIVLRATAQQDGQAMAEYAVILALVTLVAAAAYALLGGPVASLYDQVVTAFI